MKSLVSKLGLGHKRTSSKGSSSDSKSKEQQPQPQQQQQVAAAQQHQRRSSSQSSSSSSKSSSRQNPHSNKSNSSATTPLLSSTATSSSAIETTLNSTLQPSRTTLKQRSSPNSGILHKQKQYTSRVRFAPTNQPNSNLSSMSSTTSSPSQVHLMACGASVASASVVSKDSIFDRVLREENERLNAMGMGGRSGVHSDGGEGRDRMRGGRRVEI